MDNSKTILAKNIRYLMEQKQKTRTELCEALGVKYTTLSDWVNGQTVINVVLKDASELLDEVVVIGYGAVKKSDRQLVGSLCKRHAVTSLRRSDRL